MDATRISDNQLGALVSFNDTTPAADIFDVSAYDFASWNAVSAIGPIDVTDAYWGKVATDGGLQLFTSASSFDPTFHARLGVPEPAILVLLGTGLFGFGRMSRRRPYAA